MAIVLSVLLASSAFGAPIPISYSFTGVDGSGQAVAGSVSLPGTDVSPLGWNFGGHVQPLFNWLVSPFAGNGGCFSFAGGTWEFATSTTTATGTGDFKACVVNDFDLWGPNTLDQFTIDFGAMGFHVLHNASSGSNRSDPGFVVHPTILSNGGMPILDADYAMLHPVIPFGGNASATWHGGGLRGELTSLQGPLLTPVPEPSTFAMLGAAVVGVLFRRVRSRDSVRRGSSAAHVSLTNRGSWRIRFAVRSTLSRRMATRKAVRTDLQPATPRKGPSV